MTRFFLPLLVACAPEGPATRTPGAAPPTAPVAPPTADTTSPTAATSTTSPASPGVVVPRHLALPYVEVGDPAPEAELEVDAAFTASATGPFEITGTTVRFTGGTDAPVLASGELVVTVNGQDHAVTLAAVVGDPDLPAASWSNDAWGTRAVVDLPSAPYPTGDASVLIVVPDGLALTGPVHAVTHLHGHYATLIETVSAQRIVEQHAISGRDAVLIVPQGPVAKASGDFGQLMEADGHPNLVRDVHTLLYRDGLVRDARSGQRVLTAHSGGYWATAEIVQDTPIDAVHLFDALYGFESVFEDFALGGGILRSSATTYGGTLDNNERLADWLEGALDLGRTFDDPALADVDVTVGWSPSSHQGEMSDRRNYARWLVESGLPPRELAPPELLVVTPTRVRWRVDRGLPDRLVIVEGSDDGVTWREIARDDDGEAAIAATPWVRLVALTGGVRSAPSDTYGATGGDWLVVDGFDRVFGGSWTAPTHDFVAQVGAAVPAGFSSASNDAVAQGLVDPASYDVVLWLLGDESVADDTFDDAERAVLDDLVAAGVPVIVSGSEVGYASDFAVLGATYVADDAGTTQAGGYTFGVTYPEDYPDVLGGGPALWTYSTGGAAAVVTPAGIVVGFPLETLAEEDRVPAMQDLAAAL